MVFIPDWTSMLRLINPYIIFEKSVVSLFVYTKMLRVAQPQVFFFLYGLNWEYAPDDSALQTTSSQVGTLLVVMVLVVNYNTS